MLAPVRCLALATMLAAAAPVLADDGVGLPGGLSVSASATAVTDYRFRGVSLSGGDPAVQGGVTVTHDSGFYVGAWGSTIDDGGTDAFGDVELDLYGGWSGKLNDAIGLDAGLLYYAYPTNGKGIDAEFFEPYATVSASLGPVEARVGANYAWQQDSLGGDNSLYLHGELSSGIPTTPVTLNAHVGYTDGVLAPTLLAGTGDDTALDWSLGATATVMGKLTFGLSYVGVQGPSIDGATNDTVIGSVGMSF
jgi:uncharacterized protein (TIGR02001 family)